MPPAEFPESGGTFDPDSGGLSSTAFGGEFLYDDDLNGTADDLFGDAIHNLHPTAFGNVKAASQAPNFLEHSTKPGAPGFSPASHRDSSSSGSSRSAGSDSSPKTSLTSADIMMTDDPLGDWKGIEALPKTEDSNFEMFDGMVDSSMDPAQSHFQDSIQGNFFDFESASSSPSATHADGQSSLSPEAMGPATTIPTKSPNARRPKGHGKAQSQHSLTQSMQTLKTNMSREASPMYTSYESSPNGLFHPSPPADASNLFMNGTNGFVASQPWAGNFGSAVESFHGQSVNAIPNPSHGLSTYPAQQPIFPRDPPKLAIQPTPLKSRVETQIPIKLIMINMPPIYKRLHLPMYTISKAKLLVKPPPERAPDLLELYTTLVCTSAMHDEEKRKKALAQAGHHGHPTSPRSAAADEEDKPQNGGEVRICQGCITRERKRAGRKKNKKPEEDELWDRFQNFRAIVFNTSEVKEWQVYTNPAGSGMHVAPGTVQVDAPMRIACYCRHHSEKQGFRVIFTIKDWKDRVVAQQMSDSIMITDDHKTHLPANPPTQSSTSLDVDSAMAATSADLAPDANCLENPMHMRQTQSTSNLQNLQQNPHPIFQTPAANSAQAQGSSGATTPRNLSRQASPSSPSSGPVSKKRKASGSAKLPAGLTMTQMNTSQIGTVLPSGSQGEPTTMSAATSPFSPAIPGFPIGNHNNAPMFPQSSQSGLNGIQPPFATGPPTPNSNSNDSMVYPGGSRNVSVDQLSRVPQQMFSAPVSAHPSRAPSPNHMRNEVDAFQQNQLAQALYSTQPMAMSAPAAPSPVIHKIIPGEGPKSGGIEVTILGKNFTNDGLEVMFGEQRATTTTYWGESSLVCLLPPSPTTGPVIVSIRQPRNPEPPTFGKNPPIFRYVDDNEEQLMRTALAVLGAKVGSNISDVADIARSIINSRTGGQAGWNANMGSSGQSSGGYNVQHPHVVETGLLAILQMIDMDDSINKAKINLRRATTGHTMLHLACALGMIRLVAGLLSRGANVHARDNGGFTPLHFAASNNHPEIVRRLMMQGADPVMRTLSGLTPADVARSREVLRALRQVEASSRPRGGASLHSRASSATSLRSLWDEPSVSRYRSEYLSDSSEPMQSTDSYADSSDEAADSEVDGEDWLDMRRPNAPRAPQQLADLTPTSTADVPSGMVSPSAAMTAFRDQFAAQFQQFQQSMAMHLQNWQHFQMPQMQMPQMPLLPDYHNYLHNAPVMQRIASLVPNIGGSRPGSSGEQTPRDGDKQWWEMPSFFGAKEAPPPAYEDIFPQKDLDTKQATAAAAAAEYEADVKCAALYDQEQTTAESSKTQEIPALLQIGRKNAITKEQQENLQRAHAQRLKTGSSDKMLWFVWIPMLTIILGLMMFNVAPAFVSGATGLAQSFAGLVATPRQTIQMVRDRVVEIQ